MSDVKPFNRQFLPKELKINTWEDLKPFADDLLQRDLNSLDGFGKWLSDWSELEVVIGEESTWRYIRTTLDTSDKEIEKAYEDFLNLVGAEHTKFDDLMTRRAMASPCLNEYHQDGFDLLRKRWQWATDIYREENIALGIEDSTKTMKYPQINGAMMVELDGEKMTLQKAAARLESDDRNKREEAWKAIQSRRAEDKKSLDDVLSELIPIRHQMAQNAGFDNYRDYMFKSYQRFDYTPEDCFTFHDAIEKEILPLVKRSYIRRAELMGLEKLRPWDLSCDPLGRPALKAFEKSDELIEKSLLALKDIDSQLFDTLNRMKQHDYLDLDSRPNKAPGGYNCGLPESKTSFMFYNVSGRASDVETIMHETGHAAHNYLMEGLPLSFYKSYPMELAELASMSLELIAHDQWYRFFPSEEDQKRVRYNHLSSIVGFFLHMAKVDAFQHELYLNPEMTAEQRHDLFEKLQDRFDTGMVDWTGFEEYRRQGWHPILHIYEVPFYYIEYGIAQLGALQVWRNYKQDKKQALMHYKKALSMGYTKSIPETYAAAGIKFDFSAEMLKELMAFVRIEMEALV